MISYSQLGMPSQQAVLSDMIHFMKYASYKEDLKRREVFSETVDRNLKMHLQKFPYMEKELREIYQAVHERKILPSMRSLQFGGKAIFANNIRMFNCSYCHVDDPLVFREAFYILLAGCGFGYSVQRHHVKNLPSLRTPGTSRDFIIEDTIEGWADALYVLVCAYFYGGPLPIFDYSQIRKKGSLLKTSGGIAPGYEPLKKALDNIQELLKRKKPDTKLSPIEVHDILCFSARAVRSGGIRRSSSIALFSKEDEDMLRCKAGNWLKENPQRDLANNSVVVLRNEITEKLFWGLWEVLASEGSGEPNIYLTNNLEYGCNPSLRKGTKVLTSTGVFPINDLEGKEFLVRNLDGRWSPAKCWLSGRNKPLYRVKLSSGKEYYATAEHKWPVWNGSSYEKVTTANLTSQSLLPRTQNEMLFEGTLGDYEDGLLVGWLYGNHYHVCKSLVGADYIKSDEHNKLELIFESKRVKKSSVETSNIDQSTLDYYSSFNVSLKNNGLPQIIWKEGSEQFRRGFMNSLFSSSVEVGKFGIKFLEKSFYENYIQDLSELLGFYGIHTNITTDTTTHTYYEEGSFVTKELNVYSLNFIQPSELNRFFILISLYNTEKQLQIQKVVESNICLKYALKIEPTTHIKVTSVEKTDLQEDVWDISVLDDTHCFQLSHCITGNCGEINGASKFFCNLVELNAATIEDQEDFNLRAKLGSSLATFQASYTDLPLLRPEWKINADRDALIGVGMTGIAAGKVLNLNMREAAQYVVEENERIAKKLGINVAKRTTTVKPSGTSSLLLSKELLCSSGIHSYHSRYLLRRITVAHQEPIYEWLKVNHPYMLQPSAYNPAESVIEIPLEAPKNAITREEGAISLLERIKKVYQEWIVPGHREGDNTNNVSSTVNVREGEWDDVGQWWWNNKDNFVSITFLPYDGGIYPQMPLEEISRERYEKEQAKFKNFDLTTLKEDRDNIVHESTVACSGGVCEMVKF